jgi:GNAT superfamily N-acetyltransferase
MSIPGATIRDAGPSDAGILALLRYEFRSALAPPVEDKDLFLERCRRWMAVRLLPDSAWRCWLAHDAGLPIGAAWLHLLEKIPNPVGEPELHGYVSSVYVRAERRGAGIGSALIASCLHECEARGADSVFLWPTPQSRPLYARHGFVNRNGMLERRLERPPADVRR